MKCLLPRALPEDSGSAEENINLQSDNEEITAQSDTESDNSDDYMDKNSKEGNTEPENIDDINKNSKEGNTEPENIDDYLDQSSEEYDSDLLDDVEEIIGLIQEDAKPKVLRQPKADIAGASSKIEYPKEDSDTEEETTTFKKVFGTRPNMEAHRQHPPPIKVENDVQDLCFSPHHNVLVAGDMKGDCSFYTVVKDVATKTVTMDHHKRSVRQVCFSEDGYTLFTASRDKSWAAIDVNTCQPKFHKKKAHQKAIYSFYPIDHDRFATGDDYGTVKLWDLRSQCSFFQYTCSQSETVTCMISTVAGRHLAVGVADGSLTTIDIRQQKVIAQTDIFDNDFTSMALMRNESLLMCGTLKGNIYVFKWGSFDKPKTQFSGHKTSIHCMLPLTDTTLLTGCEDGNVRLINIKPSLQFKGIVGMQPGGIDNMTLNMTGNILATCSVNKSIQFWDITFLKKHKMFYTKKLKMQYRQLKSSRFRNKRDFFKDFDLKGTFKEEDDEVLEYNYDSGD